MALYTAQIEKLYVTFFNRPADFAGLAYWEDQMVKTNGNTAVIANAFAASAEYKALYSGKSTASVIEAIYQNLFGRAAEPDAIQYWGVRLDNGTFNIGTIANSIAIGAQNLDATTIANKVTAATAFTAALDTNAEILGYETTTNGQAVKDWLKAVTSDAATLTSATTALPALVVTVVAGSNANAGSTFTLTQGLDTIAGTSGNDTINAYAFNSVTGADVTTLNSVDTIDGGAGTDTLFIEVKSNGGTPAANLNGTLQGTIKNVEIINIDQTDATATPMAVDASKLGAAAQQVWQIGKAGAVTNLAATTTAGFKNVSADVSAAASTGVASVAVALDGLADSIGSTPAVTKVAVSGDALNAVTVTGTVKDGTDTGTTVDKIALAATVGKDVQTLTVNSAVGATVTVTTDSTSTKAFTTLDASGSTGAIAFGGTSANNASPAVTAYKVATVKTGSGNDTVTLKADTNAASGSTAAVGATVDTGAGNDSITIDTANTSLASTTGTTTVEAGAGDDSVSITTRSSGKLTVNLGDGTDSFTSSVAINGTDAIDAGAGSDTLLLSLVGSANVGAFSNFDVFDVKGMTANLDLDILNAKNTVTEIVGSGAVSPSSGSNVSLLNVGAGVNFRATADMGSANTVTLTQKTAGALTVTLDADEAATAVDTTADTAGMSIVASNATSLKAVFDTSYQASITGETTTGDNVSTITLAGAAATSLEVVSGGALSSNVLVYTDTAATAGKLASMTITGDRALDLSFSSTNATALTTVDASAQTGGLTFSLANLKDTGTVKLGSGTDVITVTTASTGATGFESIQNFEKTAAVAVSTATADATAAAAAITAADKIALGSGTFTVADADYNGATSGTGTLSGGAVDKGVLTFTGAGPATLADAIGIADLAAESAGEAVAFEYVGNSYVFVQGTTDIVVQLTGITGVTNFVEDGTSNNFFIV